MKNVAAQPGYFRKPKGVHFLINNDTRGVEAVSRGDEWDALLDDRSDANLRFAGKELRDQLAVLELTPATLARVIVNLANGEPALSPDEAHQLYVGAKVLNQVTAQA